jgi:hypothetical protein
VNCSSQVSLLASARMALVIAHPRLTASFPA